MLGDVVFVWTHFYGLSFCLESLIGPSQLIPKTFLRQNKLMVFVAFISLSNDLSR